MIVSIKAIVLSAIKYGESDLIVKCYTESGVRSYMLKRILKSKQKKLNKAYFQPLNILHITALHNNKGNLNYIREARMLELHNSIGQNIYKQSIAIFLSEILTGVLREEEPDAQLFEFLKTTISWLENHDRIANFHLLFLLNLTRHLGFYPDTLQFNAPFFDLQEGRFTKNKPGNPFITGKNLTVFKSLIGTNFDVLDRLNFNHTMRHAILESLIMYYELHLPGFKKPKSLEILKELFQ